MVYQEWPEKASGIWLLLTKLDEEQMLEAQRLGCPRCGGRLHRADWPRKPRGLPEGIAATGSIRLGLCCAEEGCRRRTTPPSLRFPGPQGVRGGRGGDGVGGPDRADPDVATAAADALRDVAPDTVAMGEVVAAGVRPESPLPGGMRMAGAARRRGGSAVLVADEVLVG